MSKTTPHLTSIISRIDTSGWTTILLEDVVMQLDIGAHDFEKGVKQPIRFDVEVMLEGAESPTRDESMKYSTMSIFIVR